MLRIILGILKLIGILLAVMLIMIIGISLAVLLAPVRYQGQVKKTSDETRAEVNASWLLHFVSIRFSFDAFGKKRDLSIRICGVRLNTLLNGIKKISGILRKITPVRKRVQGHDTENPDNSIHNDVNEDIYSNISNTESDTECNIKEEDADSERPDAEPDAGSSGGVDSRDPADEPPDAVRAEEEPEQYAENKEKEEDTENTENTENEENIENEEDIENEENIENEEDTENAEDVKNTEQKKRVFTGIRHTVSELPEKLRNLWYLIRSICDKIREIAASALQGLQQLQRKIREIQNRISGYLDILEKYEAKEALMDIWHEVTDLLKHYMPRKINGCLRFGTEDPALTGKLTGLLYMILPVKAADFRIEPEFTESVLETEIILYGKIRACHILVLAWRLFRNDRVMRLIKKIRTLRS